MAAAGKEDVKMSRKIEELFEKIETTIEAKLERIDKTIDSKIQPIKIEVEKNTHGIRDMDAKLEIMRESIIALRVLVEGNDTTGKIKESKEKRKKAEAAAAAAPAVCAAAASASSSAAPATVKKAKTPKQYFIEQYKVSEEFRARYIIPAVVEATQKKEGFAALKENAKNIEIMDAIYSAITSMPDYKAKKEAFAAEHLKYKEKFSSAASSKAPAPADGCDDNEFVADS
ncbi:MAG: hypothetical protein M0R33_17225 [Methylomonas sp.]|jgi:Tol biopolymer transport system component|uniref:hypothetical protein n=1 Tax=Methylomonas sp. TaxID=418 RepID=UPI0025F714D8|nr:hypothetical protein [Methylomonas sp.]MCK9608189.1 hypothetical protein [Methylomonas sp.]